MLLDGLESLIRIGVRQPLWPDAGDNCIVDIRRDAILTMIPHRDPFLFVDRITALDVGGCRIRGQRFISPEDPVFSGHFPDNPVYPGVLQLEMIGQLALCLLHSRTPERNDDIRAVKIHHAVFLHEVRGGQCMDVVASIVRSDEYGAICSGQILNGQTICAFGIMEVFFVER